MANTLYVVVYPSALAAPTSTQIAAGQDSTGSAAVFADSQATTVTDTYSFSATGLSAGTSYKASFWHDDADAADVETTGAFVTDNVGDLAAQETGSDSASINGSVVVSGTLAVQEAGSDTATISGTAPAVATGDLAAVESGSDTAALTGVVVISGTLAAQEIGSDSASMTGALLVAGTLTVQETGSDSAALVGSVIPFGGGYLSAQESGPDTAAITGTVHVSGVLQAVETGSDTATISGTAPVTVTGTLEVREAGTDSAAILGAVRITGTLAAQESGSDSASFVQTLTVSDITGLDIEYKAIQAIYKTAVAIGAQYRKVGQTATPIRVAPISDDLAQLGAAELGIRGLIRSVTVRTSDVATPSRGDYVSFRNTTYRVVEYRRISEYEWQLYVST